MRRRFLRVFILVIIAQIALIVLLGDVDTRDAQMDAEHAADVETLKEE